MSIPRKIHQLWLGAPAPTPVQAMQRSWRMHHPDWAYRLWCDGDFTTLRNQGHFDEAAQLAIKADIARLEVVLDQGGVYADSDIEVHRSIEPLLEGAELVLLSEGDLITNAFFAAAPGHPVIQRAIDVLSSYGDAQLHIGEWGLPVTGPLLLTTAATETGTVYDPGTRVLPAEAMVLPRSRNPLVVELAARRRWATHHAAATWRKQGSIASKLRGTRLRTRARRFFDLGAP